MKINAYVNKTYSSEMQYCREIRSLMKEMQQELSKDEIETTAALRFRFVVASLLCASSKSFDAAVNLIRNGYPEDAQLIVRKLVSNFASIAFILGKRPADFSITVDKKIMSDKGIKSFSNREFLADLYLAYQVFQIYRTTKPQLEYRAQLIKKNKLSFEPIEILGNLKDKPLGKLYEEYKGEIEKWFISSKDNDEEVEFFDLFMKSCILKKEWTGLSLNEMLKKTEFENEDMQGVYEWVFRFSSQNAHYTDPELYFDVKEGDIFKKRSMSNEKSFENAFRNLLCCSIYLVFMIHDYFKIGNKQQVEFIFDYLRAPLKITELRS